MKNVFNNIDYSLYKTGTLAEIIAVKDALRDNASLDNAALRERAEAILNAACDEAFRFMFKDPQNVMFYEIAGRNDEYEKLVRELLICQASGRALPEEAKGLDLGYAPLAPGSQPN